MTTGYGLPGSRVGTRLSYHEPVLGDEVLDLLEPTEGLFLDGTLGGGGHTRMILDACPGCTVLGVDRDPEALAEARDALGVHAARVRFVHERFDRSVEALGEGEELAGALLDLGVSSHQLDADARGFTFRRGAALDMRMEGGEGEVTARDLLNGASVAELTRIFREYGDEPRAARLARQVVGRRETTGIETSDDLVAAMQRTYGRPPSAGDKARIFQAVRIAVNDEIEALEAALPRVRDALTSGGVFAVISYHSVEDRAVKRAFREWSRDCVCPPELPVCACRGTALGATLTRRPVSASETEVERNPRARSARLRAWRKA